MFERRRHVTVIAEGLNIVGNVSAEGMVELHGQIEGELNCTSLHVSDKGRVKGKVVSQDVVVNGIVDGPIHGVNVALESKANVTGDIHHESLSIEKGASFDGRSVQKDRIPKDELGKASSNKDSATAGRSDSDLKSTGGKENGKGERAAVAP
jgi:cytoskeletal protein CcmA (bactofilin family)